MRVTPQEKKIRDYSKQRKNDFAENNKSSRTAIRNKKRWLNRSYRRSVNNQLCLSTDEIDDRVMNVKKHYWKKWPDSLIIETLNKKWSGSSRSVRKPYESLLRNEAIKRIKKSKLKHDL